MWSDKETTEDLLGYIVHASLIKNVVTNEKNLPITVGLYGDWGSGKSSILRILEQQLKEDNDTVVVYFDDCFDCEGPNYLLNKEFCRILSGRNVSADYEVKDLVMVNIEQLMRLENFFADGKLDLAILINSYIDYKEQAELNQVFPFNKFLFQEAKTVGYELKKTRWFDEVYENLKRMDKMDVTI